jgi:hypothetical protein
MSRPKNSSRAVSAISPVDVPALSYSLKQAAAVTGMALWHLRSAIWDGHLAAHMAGKKQIVLRVDLEKYISSQPLVRRRTAKQNRRAA